jgi:hypothetical protein
MGGRFRGGFSHVLGRTASDKIRKIVGDVAGEFAPLDHDHPEYALVGHDHADFDAINTALTDIYGELDDLDARSTALEADVTDLDTRVTDLEAAPGGGGVVLGAPPAASAFTLRFVGMGTKTVVDNAGGGVLFSAANSGTGRQGAEIYFPISAGVDFTLTTLAWEPTTTDNYLVLGLSAMDATTTGRWRGSGQFHGDVGVPQQAVVGTGDFVNNVITILGNQWWGVQPLVYRRLKRVGSTITASMSPDGVHWFELGTFPSSDFPAGIGGLGYSIYVTSHGFGQVWRVLLVGWDLTYP